MAGVRFIFDTPALLGAISLDLMAVLFGGATALLPVFSQTILHVGAFGNGLLRAAPGIGAVVVGSVLSGRPLKRRVGRTLLVVVALFGVFTIVFGLSTSFALSMVALAALAGADMVSMSIRGTLAPLLTAPALRGRVGAVERVFIGASNELGAFESGVAAALIGAVPAVVLGGAASSVAPGVGSTVRCDRGHEGEVNADDAHHPRVPRSPATGRRSGAGTARPVRDAGLSRAVGRAHPARVARELELHDPRPGRRAAHLDVG
jgi:hypothetical protein